jgi:hypothetical protein
MQQATVVPEHGLYPLGGTVDGTDQMAEHENPANKLEGGAKVALKTEKKAKVTTYGGLHTDTEVHVAQVHGKPGWYVMSGLSLA